MRSCQWSSVMSFGILCAWHKISIVIYISYFYFYFPVPLLSLFLFSCISNFNTNDKISDWDFLFLVILMKMKIINKNTNETKEDNWRTNRKIASKRQINADIQWRDVSSNKKYEWK